MTIRSLLNYSVIFVKPVQTATRRLSFRARRRRIGVIGVAHALISRILGAPGDRAAAMAAAREAATFILRGVGIPPRQAAATAAREVAALFGD